MIRHWIVECCREVGTSYAVEACVAGSIALVTVILIALFHKREGR